MKKLTNDSINALQFIRENSENCKKTVFVSGNFNILHPGHLRLLRFAKECGDYLVVGVNAHQHGITIIPEELRLEGMHSTSYVDHAFILRDNPEDFIAALQPAIVVKGKEHETQDNRESEVLKTYDGKLLFSSGDIIFSSMNLLRDELTRINPSTISKPQDYPTRHKFSIQDLRVTIEKMKKLKVVVIGDTIVDEYIICDPLGMSQEDPTIVVTPIYKEKFLGGAGIVAAHASGLGAKVSFFSVIGNDSAADFVKEHLKKNNVINHLCIDDSRPTITKQRFRAHEKTLLRVNHLRQHALSKELQDKIFQDFASNYKKIDLLIFADFNYGCLPQSLVEKIGTYCRENNIPMVADSQSSSQFGDVSRFKGMQLLTPTEREARLAVRDNNSGLVVVAENLRTQARSRNIIMTLGEEGILIHAEVTQSGQWMTDRLPAMNSAPKDLAGAGDSLITTSSLALATGSDIWQSAYLGSIAAACQVGRLGNIPLTLHDLLAEIV